MGKPGDKLMLRLPELVYTITYLVSLIYLQLNEAEEIHDIYESHNILQL